MVQKIQFSYFIVRLSKLSLLHITGSSQGDQISWLQNNLSYHIAFITVTMIMTEKFLFYLFTLGGKIGQVLAKSIEMLIKIHKRSCVIFFIA